MISNTSILYHRWGRARKAFGSLWIVLFLITGLVAFLLSFRPWPVSFQMPDQAEAHQEPGAVPHEEGSAISPGPAPPGA